MTTSPSTKGRAFVRRTLRALVLLTLLYAGASWFAAGILIHPKRKPVVITPDLRSRYVGIELKSEDGIRLSGSVVEPEAPARGTILLFHGIGDHRAIGRMMDCARRGFRVLAIDFRAHGESDGEVSTFGYLESMDVRAAVRYARSKWNDKSLFAWGASMGGAAIIYAQDVTKDLDGVVLESVYATIDDAYRYRLEMRMPAFLAPLGLGPKWAVERRLNILASEMRPVDYIDKLIPERVLLTTGERDRHAPPADTMRLAAKIPGAQTHLVPGATHNDVGVKGGAAYLDLVFQFFATRIARRG